MYHVVLVKFNLMWAKWKGTVPCQDLFAGSGAVESARRLEDFVKLGPGYSPLESKPMLTILNLNDLTQS